MPTLREVKPVQRVILSLFFGLLWMGSPSDLVLARQTEGSLVRNSESTQNVYGLGVMVGPVSGLTVKVRPIEDENANFPGPKQSIDANLATNFDDYALWSAHILTERLVHSSPLIAYIGPGITAGFEGRNAFWGISGEIGVLFFKGPYEVFVQGMPRMYIIPKIDGRIEASTGLRIYF